MRAMAMNTTMSALAAAGTMIADSMNVGHCGFWPQQSPADVYSVTRCSTTYAATSPPYGPTTNYFTSTSMAYRSKTELLTPKPSTTSVSLTSTYTEYSTAPNNLTQTIWTDTYTWTNYITTTETVSSTATVTESVLQTATIPTDAGFTPVAATYPEATQHVDDWADQDKWSVEDSYSQDEWTSQQEPEVPGDVPESGLASKVDCLITSINIYDSGTTTSRIFVPPPTYTHTAYVATESTTITVRTKVSPTETPVTYSMASGIEVRSTFTETRTNYETTTTTSYPSSTTTIYAACATDNIIDSYKGWALNNLAADWYSKNYTVIRSDWSDVTNATACCATAAAIPSSIFFKYDGLCEVFVDNSTAVGYNASKIDVEVLYEPRERGYWGVTVGNGPRGSVSFSSLWV